MIKTRIVLVALLGLALFSWPAVAVATGGQTSPHARIHARLEFVESSVTFAYQNVTGQLIDLLAQGAAHPPAQLIATTGQGIGYLYLAEVDPQFRSPPKGTYWQGLAGNEAYSDKAAEADGYVKEARDLILSYRPELSLRPAAKRLNYDQGHFQFIFIYGVPRPQRGAFESMSQDYNQLCLDRGVREFADVYEVIEDGDTLRYLVVKESAGNADFWRSETGLNSLIEGDLFDAIGMRAEAIMNSVETMSTVRLSQGRSPSPFLRSSARPEE